MVVLLELLKSINGLSVAPKARGPDPFGVRASEDRVEGERLGQSLSRIQPTHVSFRPLNRQSKRRTQDGGAGAVPLHRRGTHERSRAHAASGACDDVPGYHDEAFEVGALSGEEAGL